MTSKVFTSGTVIDSAWLNDVNSQIYGGTAGAIGTPFIQAGTGAVSRTLQEKSKENLHLSDFGGFAGASASVNTTALSAAIVEAIALGKGGVDIGPGGTWAFTAGTNFATRDISIIGVGKPTLDFSAGTGIGFKLDAGGSGVVVRGMRMENFIIKGGPSITDIFYQRGIVASQFKNIEVREGTATGFALLGVVLNTYQDCRVSNDSLAMTTTPSVYWKIDNDGTVGNRSQANTFINCDASGLGSVASTSDGWRLIDSTLNVWVGGTGESCNKGINITNDQCRLNTWIGFDLEDNKTNDAVILGSGNAFDNCTFTSAGSGPNVSIQTGKGTVFKGGYIRWAQLDATSSDTSFFGCGIDENLGGTIGIQGTGTYTSIGCTKIGGTGLVTGLLPTTTAQYVSSVGPAGKPSVKAAANIVTINGTATPLFSTAFSGMWIARDNTSAGIAIGTCDSGVPEITVLSNTIPATVAFTMVGGVPNARTTAGTVTRNIAVTAIAVAGG